MKGSRCICGSGISKRAEMGIMCSKCGNIISKTAFSYDANRNLAKMFHVSMPDEIVTKKCLFDSIDKNGKMYELKTTTSLARFEKIKINPINALSNRGQKQNIHLLDYILVGLASWKTFKIKKAFLFDVKSNKIKKEVKHGKI